MRLNARDHLSLLKESLNWLYERGTSHVEPQGLGQMAEFEPFEKLGTLNDHSFRQNQQQLRRLKIPKSRRQSMRPSLVSL